MNTNRFETWQHTTGDEIRCPVCGSKDWTCWDEQTEEFEVTDEEGYTYLAQTPVGYLKCDKGHVYTHSW